MPDKDTRPRCCHCGLRLEWDEPMAKYGTKRAHWTCNDNAPPDKALPVDSSSDVHREGVSK